MACLTDRLYMTIDVDWDVKPQHNNNDHDDDNDDDDDDN